MKKVFNKIFTLILSVISLGTFLNALSIFASKKSLSILYQI